MNRSLLTWSEIGAQQRAWAEKRHPDVDTAGYTRSVEDNLFAPLLDESRSEIAAGRGGEYPREGARGKLQALHSSAALACNVFDHWRRADPLIPAAALGATGPVRHLHYEVKLPTGLRGSPANLDVLFCMATGSCIAVESKFTEPYARRKVSDRERPVFPASYFPPGRPTPWSRQNLPACSALALTLNTHEIEFRYVDAAQLLKHVLALARSYGHGFTLVYLWYPVSDPAGATHPEEVAHREEVARFAQAIAGEVDFRGLDYRELVNRLRQLAGPGHEGYFSYLEERYGLGRASV